MQGRPRTASRSPSGPEVVVDASLALTAVVLAVLLAVAVSPAPPVARAVAPRRTMFAAGVIRKRPAARPRWS